MAKTGKTILLAEDEESIIEANRRLKAKRVRERLKAKKAEIKNRQPEPGKKLVTKKRKPKTSQVGFAKNRRKTAA